jgi:isocitrate lyase
MSDQKTRQQQISDLEARWQSDPRWAGIERVYTAEEVVKLRGSVVPRHTLAERGCERLWQLMGSEHHVHALGALSGGQAVQMVKGGLKAIYLSGWQVAADGNLAGDVFPDQSLYPVNSVPAVVERIVNDIDEIVKVVRFPGWQDSAPGQKQVQAALRKSLLKYQLHKDQDLFDRAYGYIREYY